MAGPVRHAPGAQALQSAVGSLRNRRSRGNGLRPLAARARLPPGSGTGLRREVSGDFQGVPAAPGGRQLLARSRPQGVDAGSEQLDPGTDDREGGADRMDSLWLADFWAGVIAVSILVYVTLDGYDL